MDSLSAISAWQVPPPEILRIIFDRCFGPPGPSEPLVTDAWGHRSLWSYTLRDRKSVVLVCKLWWSVGVGYLYRHVALRSVGQIPALIRTLEGEMKVQLSNLITRITVICAIPDACVDVFAASLASLLMTCPRLTTVTYVPVLDTILVSRGYAPYRILPSITPYLRCLTHLSMGEEAQVPIFSSDFLHLLCTSTQLKSLAVVLNFSPVLADVQSVPFVNLPSLEHLSLRVLNQTSTDTLIVQHKFHLPSLQRLECSYWTTPHWEKVLPLLASKGETLRSLSIKCLNPRSASVNMHNIQPLLDQCPMLEHLIFMSDLIFPLAHPTLRWIDIFAWSLDFTSWPPRGLKCTWPWYVEAARRPRSGDKPETDWPERINGFTQKKFPALERVRLIHPQLWTVEHLDLLGSMHPAERVVNP